MSADSLNIFSFNLIWNYKSRARAMYSTATNRVCAIIRSTVAPSTILALVSMNKGPYRHLSLIAIPQVEQLMNWQLCGFRRPFGRPEEHVSHMASAGKCLGDFFEIVAHARFNVLFVRVRPVISAIFPAIILEIIKQSLRRLTYSLSLCFHLFLHQNGSNTQAASAFHFRLPRINLQHTAAAEVPYTISQYLHAKILE